MRDDELQQDGLYKCARLCLWEGWCHVQKCYWYLTHYSGFLQVILGIQDPHNSVLFHLCFPLHCVSNRYFKKKIGVVNSNIIINSVNWELIIVHTGNISSGFTGLSCTCLCGHSSVHMCLGGEEPKATHVRFIICVTEIVCGNVNVCSSICCIKFGFTQLQML